MKTFTTALATIALTLSASAMAGSFKEAAPEQAMDTMVKKLTMSCYRNREGDRMSSSAQPETVRFCQKAARKTVASAYAAKGVELGEPIAAIGQRGHQLNGVTDVSRTMAERSSCGHPRRPFSLTIPFENGASSAGYSGGHAAATAKVLTRRHQFLSRGLAIFQSQWQSIQTPWRTAQNLCSPRWRFPKTPHN